MKTSELRFVRLAVAVFLLSSGFGVGLAGGAPETTRVFPNVPPDFYREAPDPPDFWVSTVEGVNKFLDEQVHKGTVEVIGRTAGGRPIRAVFYGHARSGKGTTTFSGAIGALKMSAYFGPDFDKKVYLALGSVHGGEFEGIVGLVNLISVLETGKDLKGGPWPEIVAAAGRIDRLIVIPIVNVDGRARIPVRMEAFRGADNHIQEFLNTGGWPDGRLIGWPAVKAFIPLDFSTVQFPGGYPNDNGVNLMHDDFFGSRQPETKALFDLAARERPDLILNLHTGAGTNDFYPLVHFPVMEEVLTPAFKGFFRSIHTALTLAGYESTNDVAVESDPARTMHLGYGFNLDSALNFHCGAMSTVVEFPSHAFTGKNRKGDVIRHTADQLLEEELLVQQEAMKYLVSTGGRSRWGGGR